MSEPLEPDETEDVTDEERSGPWSELTDDVLGLTDKLRTTYRRAADEGGPSEDEVRNAFRTLAGAWNQMAGSVGAAIQDPEVKRHLKKAASSLMSALGASLSELVPQRGEEDEPEAEAADVVEPPTEPRQED